MKSVLTQSMLQKFTNKIERLANNRASEISNSPMSQNDENFNYDEAEEASEQSPKPQAISDSKKKIGKAHQNQSDQENRNGKTINDGFNIGASNGSKMVIDIQDKQQPQNKSEKIQLKQLTKLVALQKQKAQQQASQNNNTSASQQSTIRKSVAPPASKSVPPVSKPANSNPATLPKPIVINQPKIAVMNNLIKLSQKITIKQLLRQIKFQAELIKITPIRLLLYFCIQKMLYYIYQKNGNQEMIARKKDSEFLNAEIQTALIKLLSYLKTPERAMISRIVKGVFIRLGIFQQFSQKWLSECIKQNKKAIKQGGVNVQQLQAMPTNTNITSNIFIGIPSVQKKIVYSIPDLSLQNEEIVKQKIPDPQIYHSEQKLFFFKRNYFSQPVPAPKKINDDFCQGNDYGESDFKIQITKIKLPEDSIRVLSNGEFGDEYQTVYLGQTAPKKRNRNDLASLQDQSKCNEDKILKYAQPTMSKQKIQAIIQQYLFANIGLIANKIAEKWNLKPQQLQRLLKQSKMLPVKQRNVDQAEYSGPSTAFQTAPSRSRPRIQTDGQIIQQIIQKSNQLQRQGINHKELVIQVFKMLQSKNLSHQKKDFIMQKWISYKKSRKANNR